MTSEQTNSSSGGRSYMLQRCGVVLGALMVAAGAGVYGFRLDRPAHQLTPVDRNVDVSLDKAQGVGRHRNITLAFKNTGRSPVKMARVHTSCGCTVVNRVPEEIVPPDGIVHLEVALTMPAYGEDFSSLRVDTEPPSQSPVEVSLLMHGVTLETPYVNRIPLSFEVTTRLPDEPVEEIIEIETGETADSSPWLSGLSAGNETVKVKVELLKREVLPKEPAPGVINCRYLFRLTTNGPTSPHSPISLPIKPIGTSESVVEPEHCVLSIIYRPFLEVSPRRILVVVDDQAEFPQTRRLTLRHANDEPLPLIADVKSSVDWISSDIVEGEQESNSQLINVTIDEPPASDAVTDVEIKFADQSNSVKVPIRLVEISQDQEGKEADTPLTPPVPQLHPQGR